METIFLDAEVVALCTRAWRITDPYEFMYDMCTLPPTIDIEAECQHDFALVIIFMNKYKLPLWHLPIHVQDLFFQAILTRSFEKVETSNEVVKYTGFCPTLQWEPMLCVRFFVHDSLMTACVMYTPALFINLKHRLKDMLWGLTGDVPETATAVAMIVEELNKLSWGVMRSIWYYYESNRPGGMETYQSIVAQLGYDTPVSPVETRLPPMYRVSSVNTLIYGEDSVWVAESVAKMFRCPIERELVYLWSVHNIPFNVHIYCLAAALLKGQDPSMVRVFAAIMIANAFWYDSPKRLPGLVQSVITVGFDFFVDTQISILEANDWRCWPYEGSDLERVCADYLDILSYSLSKNVP